MGVHVQRSAPAGWFVELDRSVGASGWSAARLRLLPEPVTIIDVGVCDGTPELYDAFPDAHLLLIDPLEEAAKRMDAQLQGRRGWSVNVAVSDQPGQARLGISADHSGASLHERPLGSLLAPVRTSKVDLDTLDNVVKRHKAPGPYMVKIDTEGHELHVLRGATHTLARATSLILEASVSQRFTDSYDFAELMAEVDRTGFELCDVLATKRGPDHLLRRMDLAFRRRTP